MKKILYSLVIISLFSACGNNKNTSQHESETLEQGVDIPTSKKESKKVKTGTIQTKFYEQKVSCTGTVELPSTDIIAVHSRIPGSIQYMKYLPGDHISKGKLLYKISSQSLVEKQREFLETSEKLWLADKELERISTLFNENAINEKIYHQTLSNQKLLKARSTGLKKELAYAGVNTDKLEKEQAYQSSIGVYAQKSGYVEQVMVNMGQVIRPEDQLMTIANVDHVFLDLQVLAKDVPLLGIGQKVVFSLPKNEKTLHAEIVKMNPVIKESNGTLQVHCKIESDDCESILPGMFVNAQIIVADREVQGLPSDAVIKEGQNYFSYKVKGNEFVKTALVNPEITEDFVIFKANEKDSFVVAGAYYVE